MTKPTKAELTATEVSKKDGMPQIPHTDGRDVDMQFIIKLGQWAYRNHYKIRTLLDNAINPPDLDDLHIGQPKAGAPRHEWAYYNGHMDGINAAIDHLAPPLSSSPQYQLVASSSDLESLKRAIPEPEAYDSDYMNGFMQGRAKGWNAAIDHLAPRIVREGFVVVYATEYQQLKDIQNTLQANINMIAAAKGEK